MSNNLINTDYFKRGMSINILQVGSSLILGFISSIVYFSKLSGKEYVIYSLIMLTVYFFVNFSSLELNQYIRKYIPVMDETKSIIFLSKILKTVASFFFVGIFIYFFVVYFTDLYSNFEEYLYLIFISVLLLSLIQLFARMLPEYVSANKKFDLIEKRYLYFLTPYKLISILIFYFLSSTLLTALIINLILRLLQFFLVIGLIPSSKNIFRYLFKKSQGLEEFNLKTNIQFTIKNFLYVNYPLLFLSLIPTFLSKNYNLDDVAVFTLVLTLFNSIKPVLYAIATILNPTIVNLKNIKKIPELYLTINSSINIIVTLHLSAIAIVWLHLNYTGFTEFFLRYFSYNLFSDFINSILVISLFFVLTMLQQSYFLASNLETKFFYSSFISTTASLIFFAIYVYFDLKINFVLGVLVVFYCIKYFLATLLVKENVGFSFSYPVLVLAVFPISLITLNFNSFFIYLIFLIMTIAITTFIVRKSYKTLQAGN